MKFFVNWIKATGIFRELIKQPSYNSIKQMWKELWLKFQRIWIFLSSTVNTVRKLLQHPSYNSVSQKFAENAHNF